MLVIVDYGMGNVGSISNMFKRFNVEVCSSSDPLVIARATRLILPGVGSFDRGMDNISRLGLRQVLDRKVLVERVPVLGICLGMQLMGRESEEGKAKGLGWVEARSKRFQPRLVEGRGVVKVPHMGWNYVESVRDHPLVKSFGEPPRFYFVHSYHLVCERQEDVLLRTSYGGELFVSAFARENIVGVQFHPEKSHRFGMKLLKDFSTWDPIGAVS
jgi:glutamine amidotransferase